ncbi:toll-like receptor 4 [Physella acuta]|uniref:toll-like receptor 4 n=1 Tax=Physella acuta TaxID=109671 RepID=UPI0027DBDD37|nr:toll-like receptor 4 [Physella acuta]
MEETNQDVTSDSSILCPTCGFVRVYFNPSLKALHVQKITPSALFKINYYIENGANITYIDFSVNGFREFNYIIKGLTGIKTIIASGNNMNSLLVNFFDSLNTVEKLALSACNLVPSFVSQNSRRLFQYLPALQWLALSSNQLDILAPNTFVDNLNLKGLNLAYNRFRSIPFEIQITPKLYVLDMRGNALTTIDASTRSELDTRSHTSAGFYLYLDGNTLSCACENLDFLMWLSSTHVILDNNRNYTCIDNSGKLTTTLEYKDVEKLWRECSGQYFFYLSIVCFSTLCIGYLLVFIINHNLTYIMSYVLQYFGNFRLHDCKDYKNGVYIGYADNDYAFACHQLLPYIEDKLGLRTFVRDRDLLPSSDVASGIVDAINASWRVVLVFSENFLRADEWMWFTIRCAVYSQTPANPARVVVLVHRRHVHQLPTELLSAVTDDSVIVVTRWEMDYVIQQKLKTLLGQ